MFSSLTQSESNTLAMHLKSFNENIDWNEFLNENSGKSDEHIFKSIQSKIWIDMSTETEQSSEFYFPYFMKLLKPYIGKDYTMFILGENTIEESTLNKYPDEIIFRLKQKEHILRQICKIAHIATVQREEISKSTIVFPIFSLFVETSVREFKPGKCINDNELYNYVIDGNATINKILMIVMLLWLRVNLENAITYSFHFIQ